MQRGIATGIDRRGVADSTTTTAEVVGLDVTGMTCGHCAETVTNALESVDGVASAEVSVDPGRAEVTHDGSVARAVLVAAVAGAGYSVPGEAAVADLAAPGGEFDWTEGAVWKQAANNTKWCLIGCAIGEFATLGYYQWAQWPLEVPFGTPFFWFLVILPLINGLATSVMLETILLIRGQMDFSNALRTAFGMSFISMLGMEIAMEATDWLLTGDMGMTWWVIPPMLIVGFLTPWPYNYWRLKKFGQACH